MFAEAGFVLVFKLFLLLLLMTTGTSLSPSLSLDKTICLPLLGGGAA
jgi:hypothetical protein